MRKQFASARQEMASLKECIRAKPSKRNWGSQSKKKAGNGHSREGININLKNPGVFWQ
jgi:hypothetical protein